MRSIATIHRPSAAGRAHGHFHTAALLVLFAALAWIAETRPDPTPMRGVDRPVELRHGCGLPASDPVRSAVQDAPGTDCSLASAGQSSR